MIITTSTPDTDAGKFASNVSHKSESSVDQRAHSVEQDACPNESITAWRKLLSARLRGIALDYALAAIDKSLAELGGGKKRILQRLRSTIAWCKSGVAKDLVFFDSTPRELTAAWQNKSVRQSCGSPTASKFYKRHASLITAIANELGLKPDYKHGIIKGIKRLIERTRAFALQNTSERLNRRNSPGSRRVDLVQADFRAQRRRIFNLRYRVRLGLTELAEEGWVTKFITLTLPLAYHPSSRSFVLAGSPTCQHGKDLLLDIFRAAMPRYASETLAGIRIVDVHETGTPHLHALMSFRDAAAAITFERRLRNSYEEMTERWRNHKVVGVFGYYDPLDAFHAIDCQAVPRADIARVTNYVTKSLTRVPEIDCLHGRRYELLGALRRISFATRSKPERSTDAELICKKRYQGAFVETYGEIESQALPEFLNISIRNVASRLTNTMFSLARAPPEKQCLS